MAKAKKKALIKPAASKKNATKPASAKKKAVPKKKNIEAVAIPLLSPANAELLNNLKGNIASEFRRVLESHGLTGVIIDEIHFFEANGPEAVGDVCHCRHNQEGRWVLNGGRLVCRCTH